MSDDQQPKVGSRTMNSRRAFLILVVAFVSAGCSMKGRVEEVAASPGELMITNRHDAGVTVVVSGGDDQYVSSATFAAALAQSLNEARIFSSASTLHDGQYELVVVIVSMAATFLGYTATVSSLWTLNGSEGQEIWSERIEGAGRSSSVGGASRNRESRERAAKDTIIKGIAALTALQL